MRIIIAASEGVPYAKTGGLADVTGTLLKELRKKDHKASLIMPLYPQIKKNIDLFNTGKTISVVMGEIVIQGHVLASDNTTTPEAYFIACDMLYDRPELYGTSDRDYSDNAIRFLFFSRAVLETCISLNVMPDVVHCNDWQTAMIPLYLKVLYSGYRQFKKTASLYTIHNLAYEGLFPASYMKYTGLGLDYFVPKRLEFYGKLNFMKAGILYADQLNTVSTTYAREILEKEHGFGLEGVLRTRRDALQGILNGIDYSEWDPSHDTYIPEPYSADNLRGKASCKHAFIETIGIEDPEKPLIGIVSRLAAQKGLDLVYQSLDILMSFGVNIAILGKGEDYYQKLFSRVTRKHKGKLFVKIGFIEPLAHLLYSGCDFFLMPSKYEPCGLGQMIAMKYGTIPVARKTGGLADSIVDYNYYVAQGNGFLFSDFSPFAMQDAVKRAICVFADKTRMREIMLSAMQADFSWKNSAQQYLKLYRKACREVSV
jgi:starch synthase